MAKKKQSQKWNTADKALMELFGINLDKLESSKPQFGSSFRPVLSVDGEITLTQPTPYNLAVHMGYMDWMEPIIKKMTHIKLPPDQFKRLTDMCRKGSRELLEPQLSRVRKALLSSEQPLYFYCVSEAVSDTDAVTGKPTLRAEGERVLCILPKTPQVARHYGLSESEIALLAPQVTWLVMTTFVGHRMIRNVDQLREAIGDWLTYLPPSTREQIEESMQSTNINSSNLVRLIS